MVTRTRSESLAEGHRYLTGMARPDYFFALHRETDNPTKRNNKCSNFVIELSVIELSYSPRIAVLANLNSRWNVWGASFGAEHFILTRYIW